MALPAYPESDILHALSQSRLLGDLDHTVLAELQDQFQWSYVNGGERLIRQGDAADCLYLVVRGRLRAFVTTDKLDEMPVGEIGPGESVGELAVLLGEPRGATVYAARDCILLKLTIEGVSRLIERAPLAIMGIIRNIVRRSRAKVDYRHQSPVSTVAVVTAGGSRGHEHMAHSLAGTYNRSGSAIVIHQQQFRYTECNDEDAIIHKLNHLEDQHGLVIYVASEHLDAWTKRCIRQADCVLLVADINADAAPNRIEQWLQQPSGHKHLNRRVLVLNHRGAGVERRTMDWLQDRNIDALQHITDDADAVYHRVVRSFTGANVGLILSGGGARGLAHIGVIKALQQNHIPVDHVGGVSMGAIIGALLAQGASWTDIRQACYKIFIENKHLFDYTLPLISLVRGKKIETELQDILGTQHIEELPLPFFCTSSNLSRGRQEIHDNGLVWRAVRASLAIPGVLPPLPSNGDLLVDGGVLNNIPADIMRRRCSGELILSDVGNYFFPTISENLDELPSAWKLLQHKAFDDKNIAAGIPGIIETLYHSATLSSNWMTKKMLEYGGLVIQPPVSDYKTLDFQQLDEIVEKGYQSAMQCLEQSERM